MTETAYSSRRNPFKRLWHALIDLFKRDHLSREWPEGINHRFVAVGIANASDRKFLKPKRRRGAR